MVHSDVCGWPYCQLNYLLGQKKRLTRNTDLVNRVHTQKCIKIMCMIATLSNRLDVGRTSHRSGIGVIGIEVQLGFGFKWTPIINPKLDQGPDRTYD